MSEKVKVVECPKCMAQNYYRPTDKVESPCCGCGEAIEFTLLTLGGERFVVDEERFIEFASWFPGEQEKNALEALTALFGDKLMVAEAVGVPEANHLGGGSAMIRMDTDGGCIDITGRTVMVMKEEK